VNSPAPANAPRLHYRRIGSRTSGARTPCMTQGRPQVNHSRRSREWLRQFAKQQRLQRNSTGYRDVRAGASDNAGQTVSAAKTTNPVSRCEASTSPTGDLGRAGAGGRSASSWDRCWSPREVVRPKINSDGRQAQRYANPEDRRMMDRSSVARSGLHSITSSARVAELAIRTTPQGKVRYGLRQNSGVTSN
jgi:hypothetical protein